MMQAGQPAGGDPAIQLGRRRLRTLALGFLVAFGGVGVRLVALAPAAQPIGTAEADTAATSLPAATRRPDITDRQGRLLAADLRIPSLYADPSLLPDQAVAAATLARILPELDAAQLARRFAAAKRFAWVKHQVTPAERAAVLEQGIPGVAFNTADHRVYPQGRAGAHVLGFVDIDNTGLAGIEHGLDRGRAAPPVGTTTLPLSLDLRVQEVVADEVGRAMTRFRAKGACGLVLDRLSGEILAMVSLPDFDPNRAEAAGPEQRRNRCTNDTYELGSIFKIVAHAMALDSGKVRLRDRFDATGKLKIGKFSIRDDHAKNRTLSVPEIFMYSSNIGTARMAFAAGGAKPLEAFLRDTGFYDKPVLEIPEVAAPQLPQRWAEVTTATIAFGHGIAVSPLHFMSIVAGLTGDGTWVPPTLLRRDPAAVPERRRLIAAATAEDLRAMMWLTVAKGTGTRGRVEGYLVGGKTGTAEKPGHRGYQANAVLASFTAMFPIEDPRYAVLVLLDEPHGDKETFGYHYGGWTAAPTVGNIIGRIGPLLGVPVSPEAAEAPLLARVEPWLPPAERVVAASQIKKGVGRASGLADH